MGPLYLRLFKVLLIDNSPTLLFFNVFNQDLEEKEGEAAKLEPESGQKQQEKD